MEVQVPQNRHIACYIPFCSLFVNKCLCQVGCRSSASSAVLWFQKVSVNASQWAGRWCVSQRASPSSLPPQSLLSPSSPSSASPLTPLSLLQPSVSSVCSGRLGSTSVKQREGEKTILSVWSSEPRWTPESPDFFAEDLNSTQGKPGHWASSRSDVRKLSLFITYSHFLIGCLSVSRQTLSVTHRWEITHPLLSDRQLRCLPLPGFICGTSHLCFNSR